MKVAFTSTSFLNFTKPRTPVSKTTPPSRRLPNPKLQIRATLPSEEQSDEQSEEQSDQWEQEAKRDPRLDDELKIAQAFPERQRHTHIFFQIFSSTTFKAATERFLTALRATHNQNQREEGTNPRRRLWLLRAVADPTFGSLHGEPHPPRCVVVNELASGYDGEDVRRWVGALDRIGSAVSAMDSHDVDWAICHSCVRADDGFPEMEKDWVVAMEVLNANWSNAQSVTRMRENLIQHAEEVVQARYASSFEVFQSVESPTCFKTMEVYPSIDRLKICLDDLDEPFATDMRKSRAAVNRVRQLHQCIDFL